MASQKLIERIRARRSVTRRLLNEQREERARLRAQSVKSAERVHAIHEAMGALQSGLTSRPRPDKL